MEPGRERSSEWYDAGYELTNSYSVHYAASPYYPLWCVLADRISMVPVKCIFDLGCGPGQLGAFLHDRGLKRYIGLDFSETCIRMAKAACPSFHFVCGDAFSSDLFKSLDYDVVISTEFLEHVERDLELLDRIRPGTLFYGSVPNFSHAGHVRYFGSKEEVKTRYISRFTDFRIDEFPFGGERMSLFLFQGVRAEKTS